MNTGSHSGFSNRIVTIMCSRIFVLTACILFIGAIFIHDSNNNYTCASGATTPCDPEYMDALEARAWMEAQREIAQNQNLILKPDSVLELTCFDSFLNRVVANSGYTQPGRIFSETTRWGAVTGFSATSTDEAVTAMVLTSVVTYLGSNFSHTYLDERSSVDHTPATSLSGGSYSCNQMGRIWHEARCMNFMDEDGSDAFYGFQWYTGSDPRQFRPSGFTCPVGGNTALDGLAAQSAFTSGLQAAYNADQALFTPAENNPVTDGGPYLEDNVTTYLNLILPGACAGSAAIPTGVQVDRPDLGTYDEYVCSIPGCSVPPSSTTCN